MERQLAANEAASVKPQARTKRTVTPRRSVGYLAGGGIISTVLGAVGGLIIGRLVDPATLGLFNGIGLVLTYAVLLELGVSAGLNRELPYFIGKGDRPRAEELVAVAQAWALTVGSLVFAILLGVTGWRLAQGNVLQAAGWFSNAILAFLLFYSDFLVVTYRTAQDFARVALARVAQQVALLALLVLVVPLNFYGLCFRAVLAVGLNVALLFQGRPIKVRPKWNARHLKHLWHIGLPIFIVGQIVSYWIVIDQTLVLRLGGTRMIGLYSMVILAMGAVETIPGAVSQVLYPRMSEQYGRGHTLREVASGIAKPIGFTALAVIPVVVIGWWLVGPVARFLVPNYADAVPAIQWALLVSFVRCFEPANALFAVARRQGMRLVGVTVGIAAYGGSLVWLIHDGVHLSAFPQAMLIGRAVSLLASFVFIHRLLARERRFLNSAS
jgi:O-antigen/teichoic acid export membrane protein